MFFFFKYMYQLNTSCKSAIMSIILYLSFSEICFGMMPHGLFKGFRIICSYFKIINKTCATSFNILNVKNVGVSGQHIRILHFQPKVLLLGVCTVCVFILPDVWRRWTCSAAELEFSDHTVPCRMSLILCPFYSDHTAKGNRKGTALSTGKR